MDFKIKCVRAQSMSCMLLCKCLLTLNYSTCETSKIAYQQTPGQLDIGFAELANACLYYVLANVPYRIVL